MASLFGYGGGGGYGGYGGGYSDYPGMDWGGGYDNDWGNWRGKDARMKNTTGGYRDPWQYQMNPWWQQGWDNYQPRRQPERTPTPPAGGWPSPKPDAGSGLAPPITTIDGTGKGMPVQPGDLRTPGVPRMDDGPQGWSRADINDYVQYYGSWPGQTPPGQNTQKPPSGGSNA